MYYLNNKEVISRVIFFLHIIKRYTKTYFFFFQRDTWQNLFDETLFILHTYTFQRDKIFKNLIEILLKTKKKSYSFNFSNERIKIIPHTIEILVNNESIDIDFEKILFYKFQYWRNAQLFSKFNFLINW